jgi:shikimate dehydrogenase
MRKFAITGNPVSHSKSPELFNAAYNGMSGMEYVLMPAGSAKESVELFLEHKLSGMNVTAPFKSDILQFIDISTDEVKIIGAANVVIRQNSGELMACNTDYMGVSGAFARFGIMLKDKCCLLLGAGGAGKAAAYELTRAGVKLTIANRTLERAGLFAEKIGAEAIGMEHLSDIVGDFEIIVNTLYPTVDCIDGNCLHAGQIILDASYTGSPLLEKATGKGCICIDGRYWILHQAILAFKLFTDIEPDLEAMRQILFINK